MLILSRTSQRDRLQSVTQANTKNISLQPYEYANDKTAAFHQSPAKIRALFGGNRSGKTEAGAFELLRACHEPGVVVWACTINNEMLGSIVAKKLLKYLSPDDIQEIAWINKRQRIPRLIRLVNGAEIHCKSYEQGREAFQGAAVRRIWLDEECNRDIFEECQARIVEFNRGDILLTMTPLKGLTWAWTDIHESKLPDVQHWTMSLIENRFLPEESKTWFISRLSQDEREKRVAGHFMMLTGAVFKDFGEHNKIKRFPIPSSWLRIRSIDFGFANPFVCLWIAQDDQEGDLYVYQEYYQARTLYKDHAQAILDKDFCGLDVPKGYMNTTVGDHDAQGRAELESFGIAVSAAKKDVEIGIQEVNRRCMKQANGKPRLYIFDDLLPPDFHIIDEIQRYKYKKPFAGRNISEEPEKIDDHTCDALRYGVMWFRSHNIHGDGMIIGVGEEYIY